MTNGIDYFNRGHWLSTIQEKISLKARREMYNLAKDRLKLKEGLSAIDVGTTPDCERIDSNCIIPWLHQDGLNVTLSSPEDISILKSTFPFARILPHTGFHNPIFSDDYEYDLATSSAVLEHCGKRQFQISHIRECARVANRIFMTTPNRWHWLEFHTKIPLIHWLPKTLHRVLLRLLGHTFWSSEDNLNLLSKRQLIILAREALGAQFTIQVESIWTLGMPSNLVLLAVRRDI